MKFTYYVNDWDQDIEFFSGFLKCGYLCNKRRVLIIQRCLFSFDNYHNTRFTYNSNSQGLIMLQVITSLVLL